MLVNLLKSLFRGGCVGRVIGWVLLDRVNNIRIPTWCLLGSEDLTAKRVEALVLA